MPQAIIKIGWMTLTGFLVWVFHEKAYLAMLLLLPFIGRRKIPSRTMKEHFDELGFKFDALTQAILTANKKDNQP